MRFYFKQYGLQRTGTNYTKLLIERNLNNVEVFPSVFGWKHGTNFDHKKWLNDFSKGEEVYSVDRINKLDKSKNYYQNALNSGLTYLIHIKNPYSLFVSHKKFMKQSTYNVKYWCNKFNHSYEKYFNLLKEKSGIIIKYEDLLINPKNILLKISEKYSLEIKENIYIEDKIVNPGSDWNVPVGKMKFDKSYYLDEKYLKDISEKELNSISRFINWEMISFLDYRIIVK